MYQLSIVSFGPYTRFDFSHEASGNAFSIVPGKGANLLNLHFGGVNVLDGYTSPEALKEAKWGKSVLLFPFPNRLDRGRYEWQGKSYVFPINNASTENAIHGFVRDEAFYTENIELGLHFASIRCRYDYDGSKAFYPFPFTFDVTFRIQDDGKFLLKTACKNLHDAPIPVGFGWHPYFRLSEKADDHTMRLPDCDLVEINERMIPTGARTAYRDFYRKKQVGDTFLDNCFATAKPSGKYKLALETAAHKLTVTADAAQCPFFQVFTPPHRESIALEPMSCNVDAFNNADGLCILHPGETWKSAMTVQYAKNAGNE
ncbi:MAG: hypothetical protein WCR52_12905 [Bacteroidota bacterium]